ncbi:MAG: DUF2892 domain-containing protein [Rhodomicrobium sp.]|nr:DUF2892 domain-containing protein [Rhodomicrobium sp.]
MMTNVGVLDAALRLAVAALLLALSYGQIAAPLHPAVLWLAWIAGLALGLSGLFRYCPIYAATGMDSCAVYPSHDR